MKTVRVGIIGGGLMGRELAAATARWCALTDVEMRPEIVSVCSGRRESLGWFERNFSSVRQVTTDWREVVGNDSVDVVYVAVPHQLHEEVYVGTVEGGKHLLGEKPFGIDRAANERILAACRKRPEVFVRCSSEFPFFPGVQRIGEMIERGAFGRVIEVEAGFLHSSDLDPNKPINWKRQVEKCGAYGVMGDLGMHVCHVPFRAGWVPADVRAVLTKVFEERPDGKGGRVPCTTWENANLVCRVGEGREAFPMTLKTYRVAPGEKNTWYLNISGTRGAARWSTRDVKTLGVLEYAGGEQVWQSVQVGFEPAFKTVTGGIFEFGFTDAMLQMWASFLTEMSGGAVKKFARCVTVEEVAMSHRLFSAALESHGCGTVVRVE